MNNNLVYSTLAGENPTIVELELMYKIGQVFAANGMTLVAASQNSINTPAAGAESVSGDFEIVDIKKEDACFQILHNNDKATMCLLIVLDSSKCNVFTLKLLEEANKTSIPVFNLYETKLTANEIFNKISHLLNF